MVIKQKIFIADRVIYARKAGEGEFGATVEDGEKISMEMACVSIHKKFETFQAISASKG